MKTLIKLQIAHRSNNILEQQILNANIEDSNLKIKTASPTFHKNANKLKIAYKSNIILEKQIYLFRALFSRTIPSKPLP